MYSIRKIMCFLNIKARQHILFNQIHKIMIFKKLFNMRFIFWNGTLFNQVVLQVFNKENII